MKCENCREREATVHYTVIEGLRKKEAHVCEECHRQEAARSHKPMSASGPLYRLLHDLPKGTGRTWSFSESAVEIFALAQDEARRSGQESIGSDHLCLALLKKTGKLTQALGEFSVEPGLLYDRIRLKLAAGKKPAEPERQTGD